MALDICSLNSGSNGNCYYLANEKDAVLIDVGLNCRETEKRMSRLGLSMNKVRAIFISHEHSDHISGLPVIARKYQLPVYITPGTRMRGRLSLQDDLARSFKAHECIRIGDLQITAFPKLHDASEPHSFIVRCREITVGVFTDIGFPCENLIRYFKQCNAAFLEANYDDGMLDSGRYPFFLKQRIRGGNGHLSNRQALELFTTSRHSNMSHLFLSHLSKDNNCPHLLLELFRKSAGETQIVIAPRDRETEVYCIRPAENQDRISLALDTDREHSKSPVAAVDRGMPDLLQTKIPVQDNLQYTLF